MRDWHNFARGTLGPLELTNDSFGIKAPEIQFGASIPVCVSNVTHQEKIHRRLEKSMKSGERESSLIASGSFSVHLFQYTKPFSFSSGF